MSNSKKAIVLLSGGIDSTTCCGIAKVNGYEIYAMSFLYGQRHNIEIEAAKKVAKFFDVKEHSIVNIDLRVFGGSALTSENIEVPKNRDIKVKDEIPVTYVPARNIIFLSFAVGWAEIIDCRDIFIGVNSVDYSGYPDCRPAFIEAFERMVNVGTKAGVEGRKIKIHTPLINYSKAQIIAIGIKYGVDYSITHSCYDPSPGGKACGICDSCLLRKKGFHEAGVEDPTVYVR
ncbi:MAG: 7-cyano-7-deazaguanine synthase QueC [Chitinispirillaceae bacterium]|nr:7-cyano-7-deazaguanine synthase QueC [Chitinispirillaceae bacterium]